MGMFLSMCRSAPAMARFAFVGWAMSPYIILASIIVADIALGLLISWYIGAF